MGFIDLHSHVLPGLDDGARTLDDSLRMLRLLREIGFDTVVATPHQKFGSLFPSREAIDKAYAHVGASLPVGSATLGLAAENMWDEVFLERSQSNTIPGYVLADGPRAAFLFELPVQLLPPRLEERLFALRRTHLLPVMAHPERYMPLWDDLPRYEALARQSALVIDLAALDGAHGKNQCKVARFLVEEDLAHAAATDCHEPDDVRGAAAGIAWIRKRLGESAVTRLLADAPRSILQGELPG